LTRKFSAPAFTATLMSGWPVKTGSATSSQVLSSGFEAQGLSSRAFGHPEECSSWQFRLAAGPEIAEQMHKREPDTRQLLIVAGRLLVQRVVIHDIGDAGQISLLRRKVAVFAFLSYSAFSPGGRVALGCQLALGISERQIKFGTATKDKARSFNCKCLAYAPPSETTVEHGRPGRGDVEVP
jgi:hypothetical protein